MKFKQIGWFNQDFYTCEWDEILIPCVSYGLFGYMLCKLISIN